jgi:hypothetical protein
MGTVKCQNGAKFIRTLMEIIEFYFSRDKEAKADASKINLHINYTL